MEEVVATVAEDVGLELVDFVTVGEEVDDIAVRENGSVAVIV